MMAEKLFGHWLMTAAVLAALGLLGGACGDGEPAKPVFRELGHESPLLELVHIHGLGFNPADGLLYVATHTGLYRLADGQPELVGNRNWDVMGFTVRGADDFIGGGHPSPTEIRDGKYPPLLGFIESKDAAESWNILAMKGEADLHAFALNDDTIYAVDATAGRFLASANGRDWEARAQIVATSIAVEAGGSVIAATPKGIARSVDLGRTWSLVVSAPPFVLVASQPGGGSWGIDGSGVVYKATSSGNWSQEGNLEGRPQAFIATSNRLFAATDRGIFESADGQLWTALLLAK